MGGVEDCRWVDMLMDEIGLALSKADETIQKSIQLWTELTKDIVHKPKQELTGQPSSGKPSSVVKEESNQHWAMCASKVPESLMQEQGNYNCYDNDCHCDDFDDEEEDETTVSENMCQLNLGITAKNFSPRFYRHHNEEDRDSSLKWRGGYELLKDGETSSEEDDESWDDVVEECYLEPVENVMEMLQKKSMCDAISTKSLVCLDDENDVSDKLQGSLDKLRSEVESLLPDSDWVYVTRD